MKTQNTEWLASQFRVSKNLAVGTEVDFDGAEWQSFVANPPIDVVTAQRDEAQQLIRAVAIRLHKLGFGTDDGVNGGDLVEAMDEFFLEFQAYLPEEARAANDDSETAE